jgi:hypothetical protein
MKAWRRLVWEEFVASILSAEEENKRGIKWFWFREGVKYVDGLKNQQE